DKHPFAISTKRIERPYLLRWAKAAVKGVKAFDPALPVLVSPILGVGVPEMHVAVDHKEVVPVMIVHVFLPGRRAPMVQRHRGNARSTRHDRMNHWPPARRARYEQLRNGLAAVPQKTARLRGP